MTQYFHCAGEIYICSFTVKYGRRRFKARSLWFNPGDTGELYAQHIFHMSECKKVHLFVEGGNTINRYLYSIITISGIACGVADTNVSANSGDYYLIGIQFKQPFSQACIPESAVALLGNNFAGVIDKLGDDLRFTGSGDTVGPNRFGQQSKGGTL